MADNVWVNEGTEANRKKIATDEIGGVHYPVYKIAYGADGTVDQVDHAKPLPVADPWLHHAEDIILSEFGDVVSVHDKSKDLLKFGRNELVDTTPCTIMSLPAGITNETYVTSDLINSIISTSALDTHEVVIEGHTSADGGLTFNFVAQTLTLTGQTAVALTTPLTRVSRCYNNNSSELVGVVSITETDTYTAGVPDTDTKVHLQISAGKQQSNKASTTMSNTDYWIITRFYCDYLKKTAGFADVELQVRLPGKVFRERVTIGCSEGARGVHDFIPYFICPKNADIRLVATAGAANTPISGGIQGTLAVVV